MKRQLLIVAVKYAVALGLLAWMVSSHWRIYSARGDEVGIAASLRRPIHAAPLVLAVILGALCNLLTFFRWYLLARAQELPLRFREAVRLGLIGLYLNTFLPGSVGGDVIKGLRLAQQQPRRALAVSTIVVDRAVGVCGLFWLVVLFWGALWSCEVWLPPGGADGVRVLFHAVMGAGMAVVVLSVLTWFLLGASDSRQERTTGQAPSVVPGCVRAEFWASLRLYRQRRWTVAGALGLAVLSHAGSVATFYLAALALFPPEELPSFAMHCVVVPVGMLIRAGFPTPGGLGGAEFAYGKFYEWLGAPFASGMLAALVNRGVSWLLAFVGYVVYSQMRRDPREREVRSASNASFTPVSVRPTVPS